MLPFLSIYFIEHSEGGDFYEKDDHSSSVHGCCRCCGCSKRSDCLRRFFRKHGRFFFAASSTAGSAAASGDTIKVGVMGSAAMLPFTVWLLSTAQPVPEAGQCRWRHQRQQLEIITEDEQGDATQAVTCFTKMVDQGITALRAMLPLPRPWLSPLRAPITICPWSPLPLPPRPLPTMPRPTP